MSGGEHRTIARAAALNRMPRQAFSAERLRNASEYMQLETIKAYDANDGEVDAWHVDAWRHEYPELEY